MFIPDGIDTGTATRKVIANRTALKQPWVKNIIDSQGISLDGSTADKCVLILSTATKVFLKQLIREARKIADSEIDVKNQNNSPIFSPLEPRHYLEAHRILERKSFASRTIPIKTNHVDIIDAEESDSEPEAPYPKRLKF